MKNTLVLKQFTVPDYNVTHIVRVFRDKYHTVIN